MVMLALQLAGLRGRGEVDDLVGLGQLHRILAQVEVSYSNSMIEALWRALKHGWLFLHQLDTATKSLSILL